MLSKIAGKGKREQVCFGGQKNSHVSTFPPPFHHAIKEIYNQDTDLSIHTKDFTSLCCL
jgi:hypothetical protein